VFDYPLTAPEVYRYLTSAKARYEEVLQALADQTIFSQVGDYFTLRGREQIVETRKRRSAVAAHLWTKAVRYGQIIAMLPFVRMVAVTGSLAMNNTDEGKDVDYMIVTASNRLWTCRALVLLVARLAKLEGLSLCPNYLVTTNALEFKERSLYVAHEVAQMIPLSGMERYKEIRHLNSWMEEYLPNASGAPEIPRSVKPVNGLYFPQKVLEIIFSLPFGSWLERWEMHRKIKKLSYEQSSSFESYFSADVCKGHIDRHGENAVTALAVRLASGRASHQTERTTEVVNTETV
jgi:predicted nucleotidyltransferase